eukprot:2778248-Ditylum_brightwellii.AAC.1
MLTDASTIRMCQDGAKRFNDNLPYYPTQQDSSSSSQLQENYKMIVTLLMGQRNVTVQSKCKEKIMTM